MRTVFTSFAVFTNINVAQRRASRVNLSGRWEKRKRNGVRSCTVLVRSRWNRAARVENKFVRTDLPQGFHRSCTGFPQVASPCLVKEDFGASR
jgi:hypothetical protein